MNSASSDSSATPSLSDLLKLMRQCPSCSASYDAATPLVLSREGETHVVHLTCGSCRGAILALVRLSVQGVMSIATLTDLSAADATRLSTQDPITGDDVLDFHEFLQSDRLSDAIQL